MGLEIHKAVKDVPITESIKNLVPKDIRVFKVVIAEII